MKGHNWAFLSAWEAIRPVLPAGVKQFQHYPTVTANDTHHATAVYYAKDKNGLLLEKHRSTWVGKGCTRKISIKYFIRGAVVMQHVELWSAYPSDHLIAKLMLLPPVE